MLIPQSRRVPILVEPVVVHIEATHEAGITKKWKSTRPKLRLPNSCVASAVS